MKIVEKVSEKNIKIDSEIKLNAIWFYAGKKNVGCLFHSEKLAIKIFAER